MKKTALIVGIALLVLGGFREGAWAQSKCDQDNYFYRTSTATGHEDKALIWVGPGHFCEMMVSNNSGATVWAMWFDAASIPTTGAVPMQEFPVATIWGNGIKSDPIPFHNGIVFACSSTEGTLTATAASACNFSGKVIP